MIGSGHEARARERDRRWARVGRRVALAAALVLVAALLAGVAWAASRGLAVLATIFALVLLGAAAWALICALDVALEDT